MMVRSAITATVRLCLALSLASLGSACAQTLVQGPASGVRNGVDVLVESSYAPLKDQRVGLITNHTGIDRRKQPTYRLLAESPQVELVALFSPEHGLEGRLDQAVIEDAKEGGTGLPVYSLYRPEHRKPRPEQLKGLDVLVFDIQDIGTRFYTYVSTMGLAMEAAAEAGIGFMVLDRVNPIGGHRVEGPVRQGASSFTAYHEVPVRHGMTVGELARMIRAERDLDLDLVVIPVKGWQRDDYFDRCDLPWVNPSPNIRSLDQALLYPGIGLLEFTNLSVGRGTNAPFERIGAPWIDENALLERIKAYELAGLEVEAVQFTPASSVYANELCRGLAFRIRDREHFLPITLGLALARELERLHAEAYELEPEIGKLFAHPATAKALARGDSADAILASWQRELDAFRERRKRYLLYP